MDSITELGKLEAQIFKKGSGAGSNLSTLRSCKEPVTGGGTASGPISFLKAHDVLAGVVKSGGTLRRSAKLACLNINHPDIEDFIDCKLFEEEKLAVLRKAGIKNRPGYDLADEVYFQNTNLSVRITDEFMKRVIQNETWDTKFIKTKETCKTYKAKDLLRKIAETSWKIADPGVMFHDSFNRWNTLAVDGTIESTNPCLPIWAPILTPDGYRYLKDITNQIVINNSTKLCSNLIKTGENKHVFEIKLKNGMSLYATNKHKISTKRGDVELSDLQLTDEVKMDYTAINFDLNRKEYEIGFIAGYLFSEGSIFNTHGNKCISFSLGISEFDYEKHVLDLLNRHIPSLKPYIFSPHFQKPNTCKTLVINRKDEVNYILINIFKAITKDSFDLLSLDKSLSYQKGFIEAFTSFDGHVLNRQYAKVVKISQSGDRGYNILRQIQLSLASFGVYSSLSINNHEKEVNKNGIDYVYQTAYNLEVNDCWTFGKIFKLWSSIKQQRLNSIIAIPKKHPSRIFNLKDFQRIKEIIHFSQEDVYDINVPNGNHFVTCGAVVHNCGEFASLPNTSCNLASINLMKFFSRDVEGDIVFDYITYKDVITTIITGQDIIIDKSSFPSLDIGLRSAAYRNLGLGYTNLGGLLIWLGVPYDSNEGRYIASQLTALMTGLAYETSADLADKVGSFIKFKDNEVSFRNVLKQHFDVFHKTFANVDPVKEYLKYITKMCYDTWNKVIDRKQFRNAQVTLLAPTGCLKEDSYILSSEGITEIQDLNPNQNENQWKDISFRVIQENSIEDATKFYSNGFKNTIKIISEDGYFIEGTPNHKIRIVNDSGDYIWKRLDEIKFHDQLALRKGGHEELLQNKDYIDLIYINDCDDENLNRNKITLPRYLDENLAFILGNYMGDGNTSKDGLRFAINYEDDQLIEILENSFVNIFSLPSNYSETAKGDCISYYFNSKILRKFFEINNFVKDKGNHGEGAASAFIPKQILKSRTSVLCSFIRGLFDTDGTVCHNNDVPIVEFSTVSEKLAKQLQIVLLSLNIACKVSPVKNKSGFSENRRTIFRVRVSSLTDVLQYKEKIGFSCARKSILLENFSISQRRGNVLRGKEIWKEFRSRLGRKVLTNDEYLLLNVKIHQGGSGSLYWANDIINKYPQAKVSKIGQLIEKNILINRVEKIEYSQCETQDISVPKNNTYIANGFISHNTISFLMNSITTGIEPEYSLIRYKRLAGSEGATLKIVSPIVEESLKNLGYSEDEIPKLVKELTKDYTNIKDEDLEKTNFRNNDRDIFLTAAPTPGTNLCIPYMGHVKMCASVQPFLSGAISKTINLPKECTVDEIYNLYIEAWQMGLKGITIYRDGSKNFQPLTTVKEEKKEIPYELIRKRLPDERPAITHKFKIGSSQGYVTCGLYPNTNKLGEIFVNVSKEGSVISGFADALATVLSIALQYGVPLKDFVRKLSHLKFEPNGFTTNPDIRVANSIVDYIARYIGLKFLSEKDKLELGLTSHKDDNGILLEDIPTNISTYDQDIGPSCPNCGSIMRRLGSCYFCNNCSYNQGSCG